jgi:hypothetical protein
MAYFDQRAVEDTARQFGYRLCEEQTGQRKLGFDRIVGDGTRELVEVWWSTAGVLLRPSMKLDVA